MSVQSMELKIVILGAERTGKTALVKKVGLPPHSCIIKSMSTVPGPCSCSKCLYLVTQHTAPNISSSTLIHRSPEDTTLLLLIDTVQSKFLLTAKLSQ